jgi:hypothetical protein
VLNQLERIATRLSDHHPHQAVALRPVAEAGQ